MSEILTGCLTDMLMQQNGGDLDSFRTTYLDAIEHSDARTYYLEKLAEHGVNKSTAIENSGLEIHYAYQILNGTKHPKRDKVLCLCIGGGLTLQETNRVLERAELGSLYPKRMRDAIIMIGINRNVRAVWRINEMLSEYGETLLS